MITQLYSVIITCIFDDLFRQSLCGRCLSSLDRLDLLVPQSRITIIATILFPKFKCLWQSFVREQFCHQRGCFDQQTAKKLQLIDSAACGKLRFKLSEMNLTDLWRRRNTLFYIVKAVVL